MNSISWPALFSKCLPGASSSTTVNKIASLLGCLECLVLRRLNYIFFPKQLNSLYGKGFILAWGVPGAQGFSVIIQVRDNQSRGKTNTCWALQGAPFIPQWLVALSLCLWVEDLTGGYMPDGPQKVMMSHNPGSWEELFSRDRWGWL